jgi:hypothetical protein
VADTVVPKALLPMRDPPPSPVVAMNPQARSGVTIVESVEISHASPCAV